MSFAGDYGIGPAPLTRRAQLRMVETIDECLKHPNPEISEFAVAALRAMTKEYFVTDSSEKGESLFEEDIKRFPEKYCDIMRDNDNPGARRGFVLALGVLPYSRWASRKPDMFSRVLDTVVAATKKGSAAHERDAETRRNAVRALGDLCEEVAVDMTDEQLSLLFDAVLSGIDDYSTDSRGDVGSWVRVSSMNAIPKVLRAIVKRDMGLGPIEQDENNNQGADSQSEALPAAEDRMPAGLTAMTEAMKIDPSAPATLNSSFRKNVSTAQS